MLSIADRFNVAVSSVFNCRDLMLKIISGPLMRKYIKWPSLNQARDIEAKFKNICGFPGVIGAIDGCHIKAKIPLDQHDSYQDRKFQHSISIQAICSSDKLFLNIASGFPGSLHDARILRESTLFKNIVAQGEENYFYGKYHLVGDSAYPCKNWLIPPYRKSVASGSTKVYPDDSNDLLDIELSFIHPAFEVYSGVPKFDIALIQLAKPLKFNDKVQAVKLPDTEDVPFHASGVLTGWGTLTAQDTTPATNLQKVSVELSNDDECSEAFEGAGFGLFSPTHHLCSNDHGSGQCLGDSGSGLVINGTLYGVGSWAIKGCGSGPGAYSRLTNPEYRDWIKDTSGI